jgi:SWI/SNF chromatin-remodeling complex subunit SWI1
MESTPGHGGDFAMPSPAPTKSGSMSLPSGHQNDAGVMTATSVDHRIKPFGEKSDEYSPCSRELTITHGGLDLVAFNDMGMEVERWKPDVPPYTELGVIDVHALTRSLQSGLHSEVRLALDTLATVTIAPPQHLYVYLRACEDLIEALVDCAEEQIELLAEKSVEVSDEIQLTPYEDVARACRIDRDAIREIPVFGTPAYNLDRAVDRVICVTTILRNLSFPDSSGHAENQLFLADETVIKFLCVVIRYLGTRQMLFRTHFNTLDFMKDAVTLLSNIASLVEIPGKEEALCLLQFLLAFAPSPGPTISNDKMFFPAYEPLLHPYLPHAIDTLAKLFARDEPNRTHYKTIFAIDANSSSPHELLSRTFALAICPIPDQTKENRPANMPSVVEARKPVLMQGLLAAEVLASLAPGYESDVTRLWLSSGNGFAQNLFRLVRALCMQFEQPPRHGPARAGQRKDTDLVYIVCVSVSMLRKLAEKARDPNNPLSSIPPNVLPSRDSLLGALQMPSIEWAKEGLLQDLVAYAALED